MARKRHTAEQIIAKLRTAEIELAKGSRPRSSARIPSDTSGSL